MDEEKLDKLAKDINTKIEGLEKKIDEKADPDQLADEKNKIEEQLGKLANKEDVETLQEHINKVEEKINDLAMNQQQNLDTVESQIDKFLNTEDYKKIAKERSIGRVLGKSEHELIIQRKANEITASNSLTETNAPIPPVMTIPGAEAAPRRPILLYDLFSKGVTQSDQISWVERTSETSGAAMTAEGGAFGQSYGGWTSYTLPVRKISNFIKVGRETLEDVDFIRSEINSLLTYHIPNLRETQLLSGDGTSNNLTGVTASGKAKAFSISDAEGVSDVTEYDCLVAMLTQIALGNTSDSMATGFTANGILMNPVDILNMRLKKDANNNYVIPPFIQGLNIEGARVYPSQRITAGYVLAGDFTKGKIYTRRNMEIKMWEQNDTDPIYDYITFTATERLVLKISAIEAYAFVYDAIDDIKTALAAE